MSTGRGRELAKEKVFLFSEGGPSVVKKKPFDLGKERKERRRSVLVSSINLEGLWGGE